MCCVLHVYVLICSMSYMMVAANSPTNLEQKTHPPCSWSFMIKINVNMVKHRQHLRFSMCKGLGFRI